VGRIGECLKCGKAGHRVYTLALFYTCYLCVFALTPPANLPHFLIYARFWFNTVGLFGGGGGEAFIEYFFFFLLTNFTFKNPPEN
jgi:hypothetical protein